MSTACLSLGRAHLSSGARQLASKWFIWAAQCDPMCVAAVDELSSRRLLTQSQEVQLLQSLDWNRASMLPTDGGTGDAGASAGGRNGGWLADYYALRLCRHDSTVSVANRVAGLQAAGLGSNTDVLTATAELLYAQHQPVAAAAIATRVRRVNPHDARVMPVHIAAMCIAGDPNELFLCAHRLVRLCWVGPWSVMSVGDCTCCGVLHLVRAHCFELVLTGVGLPSFRVPGFVCLFICPRVLLLPRPHSWCREDAQVDADAESPMAWFAVGCYYASLDQHAHARAFFQKAIALDSAMGIAYLAIGRSASLDEESDQAVAAYRTAARLLPGSHLPHLGLGTECLRTDSLGLADRYLRQARAACPTDPMVYNELGVLMYRTRRYKEAVKLFAFVIQLAAATAVATGSVPRRSGADVATAGAGAGAGAGAAVGVGVGGLSAQLASMGLSGMHGGWSGVEGRGSSSIWEAAWFNLGHCHRRLHNFGKALAWYVRVTVLRWHHRSPLITHCRLCVSCGACLFPDVLFRPLPHCWIALRLFLGVLCFFLSVCFVFLWFLLCWLWFGVAPAATRAVLPCVATHTPEPPCSWLSASRTTWCSSTTPVSTPCTTPWPSSRATRCASACSASASSTATCAMTAGVAPRRRCTARGTWPTPLPPPLPARITPSPLAAVTEAPTATATSVVVVVVVVAVVAVMVVVQQTPRGSHPRRPATWLCRTRMAPTRRRGSRAAWGGNGRCVMRDGRSETTACCPSAPTRCPSRRPWRHTASAVCAASAAGTTVAACPPRRRLERTAVPVGSVA